MKRDYVLIAIKDSTSKAKNVYQIGITVPNMMIYKVFVTTAKNNTSFLMGFAYKYEYDLYHFIIKYSISIHLLIKNKFGNAL
jgi:hypothetical protein